MTVRRRLALSAALIAASSGCAASRVGHLSRPEPIAQTPQSGPTVAQIVARQNQNAAQVESLAAEPVISAKLARLSGGVSGHMVFERPHNFRLQIERGMGHPVADIGSNDEEFWFWGDDKNDQTVYVCRYDAAANPAGGTELAFQPDWIVEALGLREIPPEEARQIKVTNGPPNRPNTVKWEHYRTTLRGETTRKVTLVDRTTGAVVEHQFYLPRANAPIAVATPIGTKEVALTGDSAGTVRLPAKIHLKLSPTDPKGSPVEMDLVMNELKVNEPIEDGRRTALFTVPNSQGRKIYRLDEGTERAEARSPVRAGTAPRRESRQSLPAPGAGTAAPSDGATLGAPEPAPFGADEAYLKRSDPMPLEADLGRGQEDKVIGLPMPQPPENPAERMTRRDSIPYPR